MCGGGWRKKNTQQITLQDKRPEERPTTCRAERNEIQTKTLNGKLAILSTLSGLISSILSESIRLNYYSEYSAYWGIFPRAQDKRFLEKTLCRVIWVSDCHQEVSCELNLASFFGLSLNWDFRVLRSIYLLVALKIRHTGSCWYPGRVQSEW